MDKLVPIIEKLIEVSSSSVNLLMDELLRYYLITTGLHLLLVFVITGIIYRFLSLGKKFLDLCEPSQSRTLFKFLYSTVMGLVLIVGLVYAYTEAKDTIKLAAAPHIFLIEKVKELLPHKEVENKQTSLGGFSVGDCILSNEKTDVEGKVIAVTTEGAIIHFNYTDSDSADFLYKKNLKEYTKADDSKCRG
jgi:hypothetical protein